MSQRKAILPILVTSIFLPICAQTINQRRPASPSEGNIPDNSQWVRAPRSRGKQKVNHQSAVPEQEQESPPAQPPPERTQPPATSQSHPPAPNGELTLGETLASVFAILQLPPPFESAVIHLPKPTRILLADPNAYTGSMGPWNGTVTWINKGQQTKEETVTALNGWAIIRYPSRELGDPDRATVTIRASRPVIAIESWWSDTSLFGDNISKLLLRVAPNWGASPRKLTLDRIGYREHLLPASIPVALAHSQVGPVLRPFLLRSGRTEEELKNLTAGGVR